MKNVFVWLIAGFFMLSAVPAQAKDGGDEKCVSITEWQCLLCDKYYYTFSPDMLYLDKDHPEYKGFTYQQANFKMLLDKSRSIPKCPKADGGHIFDKKRVFTVSPSDVSKNAYRIVVLKNGGALNLSVQRWKCGCCGSREGYSFKGDDYDMVESVFLNLPLQMYRLAGGTKIDDCHAMLAVGWPLKMHIPCLLETRSVSSMFIAENISNFWYSN